MMRLWKDEGGRMKDAMKEKLRLMAVLILLPSSLILSNSGRMKAEG
jgi:hypothetical protein